MRHHLENGCDFIILHHPKLNPFLVSTGEFCYGFEASTLSLIGSPQANQRASEEEKIPDETHYGIW
jgi:hypothetical protein